MRVGLVGTFVGEHEDALFMFPMFGAFVDTMSINFQIPGPLPTPDDISRKLLQRDSFWGTLSRECKPFV